MKVATVPWPLAKDALPFPANVVTFQMQGGSALSPTPAQFAGVIQGMAGAVPPAQYDPTGHCVSNPFTQEYPGAGAEGQARLGEVLGVGFGVDVQAEELVDPTGELQPVVHATQAPEDR